MDAARWNISHKSTLSLVMRFIFIDTTCPSFHNTHHSSASFHFPLWCLTSRLLLGVTLSTLESSDCPIPRPLSPESLSSQDTPSASVPSRSGLLPCNSCPGRAGTDSVNIYRGPACPTPTFSAKILILSHTHLEIIFRTDVKSLKHPVKGKGEVT